MEFQNPDFRQLAVSDFTGSDGFATQNINESQFFIFVCLIDFLDFKTITDFDFILFAPGNNHRKFQINSNSKKSPFI